LGAYQKGKCGARLEPAALAAAFATSLAVWATLWGLCCALYRRKIFVIKI
jgi:hypothetical protein